jgi:phosphoribosylformylglycinamidine synthase
MTCKNILFFKTAPGNIIAVEADKQLTAGETDRLSWLFGNASPVQGDSVSGTFIGPRREMITPWSTNAVEITQNMAVTGISRIEEYFLQPGKTLIMTRCFNVSITDSTRTYLPFTMSLNR